MERLSLGRDAAGCWGAGQVKPAPVSKADCALSCSRYTAMRARRKPLHCAFVWSWLPRRTILLLHLLLCHTFHPSFAHLLAVLNATKSATILNQYCHWLHHRSRYSLPQLPTAPSLTGDSSQLLLKYSSSIIVFTIENIFITIMTEACYLISIAALAMPSSSARARPLHF